MSEERSNRGKRDVKHLIAGPTERVAKEMADLIRAGYSVRHAATKVGLARGRLKGWMNPKDDASPTELLFVQVVNEAISDVARSKEDVCRLARQRIVDTIVDDDDPESVRVARWYLERIDPDFMPKAKQELDAKVQHDVTQMSNAELEAIIAAGKGVG